MRSNTSHDAGCVSPPSTARSTSSPVSARGCPPNRSRFRRSSHMADSKDVLARIEKVKVGGIDIARLDLADTADLMVRVAQIHSRGQRPLNFTSANGEMIARVRSNLAFPSLSVDASIVQ